MAALFIQAFGFNGLSRTKILAGFLTTPVSYLAACFAGQFSQELCFGFLKAVKSKVSNVKLSYGQKMFYLN